MNKEKTTVANGCFWCTETIFKRLKGVTSVEPGYSGGTKENPTYEEVVSGDTGHAESIQIQFNPSIISFEKLLEIFWHTHDPTTLNQQGYDHGTQYRSAIFYHDEKQKKIATRLKNELDQEKVFSGPIVTEITKFSGFYPAEDYHKNFYESGQRPDYCRFIIDPKLHKLLKEYSSEVKDEYKA